MQQEPAERLARAQAFFDAIPHSRVLGLELVDFRDNTATARVAYRAELIGNPANGSIHGGVIITLIDQTSGVAVFASLPEPEMVATLDLRIDYLRTPRPGAAVYARAHCHRITAAIAFVRCEVYHDQEAEPVAVSISSFMRTGSKLGVMAGA